MDLNLRVEEVLLMGRYPYKKFFSSYDDQDYKLVDQAIKPKAKGPKNQVS